MPWKKSLVALLLFSATLTDVRAEHVFSETQLDNLQYAYKFGEQFTKSGEFKKPHERNENGLGYLMAAIAWQESSAGINTIGEKGHKAYGMFQNYLPTVKSRFKQMDIDLPDQFIINLLQGPRVNSATWAYIELSYWLKIHNGNTRKALASYNAGWNTKSGKKYAQDVLTKAKYLKGVL